MMINDDLDPLIKREFEALGLNIVSNDLLVDLVIERVKKRRIRKWIVAGVVALSLAALASLSYVIGTSNMFSSKAPIIESNSYVIPADKSGGFSLPQYANLRLNGTTLEERTFTFTFSLKPGQMIEIFTEPRESSGGILGELTVYKRDTEGNRVRVQSFDIGSGLGTNEFGDVKSEGLYDFVYSFNDLNYRGSVRVGILLGRN
jgi:hypothetical protein